MSKHLARLRQQQELQKAAVAAESTASEDESDSPVAAEPFNPFSLLSDGDNESDKAASEDGEAKPESPKKPVVAQPKPSSKQKKKAKKKQQQHGSSEDDIQQALRELNISLPAEQAQSLAAGSSAQQVEQGQWGAGALPAALAVDSKRLHPQEELKAKYGSRVMQEEQAQAQVPVEGAPRRYRRLAARGALRTTQLPRSMLVTLKDHWPQFDGGLSMEQQAPQMFTYAYGSHYRTVEHEWKQVERSHNPEALHTFLRVYPYHLGALMAMFNLYTAYGQSDYAQDAVERALYAMELGSHYNFKPTSGLSRLDATQEINRPAFHALFRHMQNLSRRGLHSTALEVCKLLINLEPSDPMRALFYLDYLALRSRQYDVLEALATYRQDEVLYPSLAFNLALGRYFREQGEAEGDITEGNTFRRKGKSKAKQQSLAVDADQPSADETLLRAVLMYPVAVQRLMSKLRKDKGVGKDGFWDSVLQNALFANATDNDSASLSHLVNIWVERNHMVWKSARVLEWLRAVCNRATRSDAVALGLGLEEWQSAVAVWYPASKENTYSGAIENYSDHVAVLPMDQGGNQNHEQLLQELQGIVQQLQQDGGRAPLGEAELQGRNPLLAFLETLMPWVTVEPDAQQEQQQNDEQQQQ